MKVDDVLATILRLHDEEKWLEILQIRQELAHADFDWHKLLWVWPAVDDLQFIADYVNKLHLNQIVSIGCGTGLFEWLLQKASDIPVIGIEIDELWWSSQYSSPNFIPLQYTTNDEIPAIDKSSAILFCYFNNGPAFQQYVNTFKGNLVIIIGPGPGRGTHTNPTPFSPNFGPDSSKRWMLRDSKEIGDGTKDFIAIYERV